MEAGHRVQVVARHAHEAALPRLPSGETAIPVRGDVLDPVAVRAAARDTDVVINLAGAVTLPSPTSYYALHEGATRNIAEATARARVRRLIHVSALGIREDAPSVADRSKAAGERALRAAFAPATVVRPSLVFGDDDHFFNRMAGIVNALPVIPLIGAQTRFQPVHVDDLALALVRISEAADSAGMTIEGGGAQVFTLRELVERLALALSKRRWVLPLPYAVAAPLGAMFGLLPNPPFTREQVELMRTDKVVAPGARGVGDFGVKARGLTPWLNALAQARRR
jgi:NADH dehydrogenase